MTFIQVFKRYKYSSFLTDWMSFIWSFRPLKFLRIITGLNIDFQNLMTRILKTILLILILIFILAACNFYLLLPFFLWHKSLISFFLLLNILTRLPIINHRLRFFNDHLLILHFEVYRFKRNLCLIDVLIWRDRYDVHLFLFLHKRVQHYDMCFVAFFGNYNN